MRNGNHFLIASAIFLSYSTLYYTVESGENYKKFLITEQQKCLESKNIKILSLCYILNLFKVLQILSYVCVKLR